MRYNLRATAMAPQVVMAKKLFNLEKMRLRKKGMKEPNKHYILEIDRNTRFVFIFKTPTLNFYGFVVTFSIKIEELFLEYIVV